MSSAFLIFNLDPNTSQVQKSAVYLDKTKPANVRGNPLTTVAVILLSDSCAHSDIIVIIPPFYMNNWFELASEGYLHNDAVKSLLMVG